MDEFALSVVKYENINFKYKAAFPVMNYFPHAHMLVQLIINYIYIYIYIF